jgi:hypothetical protein
MRIPKQQEIFFLNLRSNSLLVDLHGKHGDGLAHFQSFDSFIKASFVLKSEVWEDKIIGFPVKNYILGILEFRYVVLIPEFNSPSLRVS